MKIVLNHAAGLIRLTLADRAVCLTAVGLVSGVLLIVMLYALTSGAPAGDAIDNLHQLIGLSRDGSLAELVNYGLAFLASVLFFLSFIETRSMILLFSSVFMGFVWLDDAGQYHEHFGRWLASYFELDALPGLRAQDTGEILAWSAAGLVLLVPLVFGLLFRRDGDLGILASVTVGVSLLVFCGFFVDFLHVVAPQSFDLFFEIVEDGGEMLAVTYLAILALSLARNAIAYYDAVQFIESVDREETYDPSSMRGKDAS